jgi:hypothetical protein
MEWNGSTLSAAPAAAGEVGVREEPAATEFRQIYSPRTPMQSQSGA